MSDDFTRDTSTTGVVSVGAGATGVIETRGDIDWFEVTLQASRTYRLTWRGYRPAPAPWQIPICLASTTIWDT